MRAHLLSRLAEEQSAEAATPGDSEPPLQIMAKASASSEKPSRYFVRPKNKPPSQPLQPTLAVPTLQWTIAQTRERLGT